MAYIGKSIESGTFSVLDTSGNTYNGSNTAFNLGTQVGSVAQLLVSHDGVIQKPGTDYTLSSGGAAITFTTAPASGASIFITEISGAVGGPLDSDLNGTELILDADGDTTITADTDDQIDIKIAGSDDFKLTAKTLTIGGGAAADTAIIFDGNAQDFYIALDDSGDEFQIGRGGTIGAGREFSIGASGPVFNEDSDTHDFRVETDDQTHALFIHGANDKVSFNEAVSDTDPGGLCLNQGSADGAIFSLKSSDIAHGITDQVETDTYFRIKKFNATNGGVRMQGFGESSEALNFQGEATASNTATGTGAQAPIMMFGNKKSGTNVATMGADDNIFVAGTAQSTVKFLVKGDGDIYYDGADQGAYDTYEDAHLARALDLSRNKNLAGVINSKFDDYVKYNHETLANANLVGREEDGTPNHFISVTGMQRLHNGAIWQQYEKHNQLLEAVYDLAKEAVGEEKANAILDKHEVKRLN